MRSFVFSLRGLLFHHAWLFFHVAKAQEDLSFAPNCFIDEYYRDIQERDPSSWTRSELELLLNATHHSVSYNEKGRDTEDIPVALMDIEWNVSRYNVHLIYRDLALISWE
jgi:DNA phosphorothioation-dependent restriction protein DptG